MRFTCACNAALAAALLMLPVGSRAEDPGKPDELLRKKRLEFLESRVDQFEIEVGGEKSRQLKRGAQPILRWSNPVSVFVNDGITFLFPEGGRPAAVVTVRVRSREASLESGQVWREFVSLSGEPLVCRRDSRELWSPKSAGLVNQLLVGAPPPADRPGPRLTQMRELARRFQAITYRMDSPNELRLLTQPLYRYQDEAAGILDGALFAFAEANDPDALLLLEAVADEKKEHQWRYTLTRMTSLRVAVRLDDREVFSAAPYWSNRRTPADPYLEADDGPFSLDDPAKDAPKPDEPK